jgi:UDP-2-acetamido-3-amino-2,3-dideoxy-glucuronate N-acetyltransferase
VTGAPINPPSLVRLPTFAESDGTLTVGEFGTDLPFEPRRMFLVFDVPATATRACHAQRRGAQLLVAVNGSCQVDCFTGIDRSSYRLGHPTLALHVPPGNWITCRDFTSDATLMVLASTSYDRDDQIEDFDHYLQFAHDYLTPDDTSAAAVP